MLQIYSTAFAINYRVREFASHGMHSHSTLCIGYDFVILLRISTIMLNCELLLLGIFSLGFLPTIVEASDLNELVGSIVLGLDRSQKPLNGVRSRKPMIANPTERDQSHVHTLLCRLPIMPTSTEEESLHISPLFKLFPLKGKGYALHLFINPQAHNPNPIQIRKTTQISSRLGD